MNSYELIRPCLYDLNEIFRYNTAQRGEEIASQVETLLLSACGRLAVTPGLGHRRTDLTNRPFYFYSVGPYLIVYARGTDPLRILAIMHSARDLKRLLRTRITRP